jgi:cyclophilin family peptidyl-prolyl cis-trans isomerase
VEPGFVIQGGDPLGQGNGGPGYTVPGEFNLKHVKGAIAMARLPDGANPNRESSGSQFYITLDATPFLDGQYSAFGVVEQGMEVVQQIQIGDIIKTIVIEEQ